MFAPGEHHARVGKAGPQTATLNTPGGYSPAPALLAGCWDGPCLQKVMGSGWLKTELKQ